MGTIEGAKLIQKNIRQNWYCSSSDKKRDEEPSFRVHKVLSRVESGDTTKLLDPVSRTSKDAAVR